MTEPDPDLVQDLMATVEHLQQELRTLAEAGAHLAWKHEYRDLAWFHSMSVGQQEQLGCDGLRPWRGAMDPALVHLIHVLEEMEAYEAPLGVQPNA